MFFCFLASGLRKSKGCGNNSSGAVIVKSSHILSAASMSQILLFQLILFFTGTSKITHYFYLFNIFFKQEVISYTNHPQCLDAPFLQCTTSDKLPRGLRKEACDHSKNKFFMFVLTLQPSFNN